MYVRCNFDFASALLLLWMMLAVLIFFSRYFNFCSGQLGSVFFHGISTSSLNLIVVDMHSAFVASIYVILTVYTLSLLINLGSNSLIWCSMMWLGKPLLTIVCFALLTYLSKIMGEDEF